MSRRLLLLLLVALGVAAAPRAQETVVLTLDEARALARAQAAPVLSAELDVEAAEAERRRAAARRWPTLDVFGGTALNYGLTFDQTVGAVTRDAVRSADASLQTEYTVFDGFERRALRAQAAQTLRAARIDQDAARLDAELEVLVLYFELAGARAALDIAAADLQAQRTLLDETTAQVDVGIRAPFEVAQQRERVAAARGDSLALLQDEALAETRLRRVLRLDPTQAYAFDLPAPPEAPDLGDGSDVDLIEQAWARRPSVLAADARIEAAQAAERAAAAARLPSVSVFGAVGSTYSSSNELSFADQASENRAAAVGVRVQIPLLDQGATRYQRALARVATDRQRLAADEARRAVAQEIREIRVDLLRAGARLEAAAIQVAAAEAALEAEVARYETGLTTIQNVTLSRARLIESQISQVRLRLRQQFGTVRLALAAGASGIGADR